MWTTNEEWDTIQQDLACIEHKIDEFQTKSKASEANLKEVRQRRTHQKYYETEKKKRMYHSRFIKTKKRRY